MQVSLLRGLSVSRRRLSGTGKSWKARVVETSLRVLRGRGGVRRREGVRRERWIVEWSGAGVNRNRTRTDDVWASAGSWLFLC